MSAVKKAVKIIVQVIIIIILLTNITEANNLFLNGERNELVIEQGRTMLPLKEVGRIFATKVKFNQANKEIRLQNPAVKIRGRVGSNIVFVNSRPQVLQLPIKKINNQVMIPLYFLHNIYGGNLSWNPQNDNVSYQSNKLRVLGYNRDDKILNINLELDLATDYSINYLNESKELIIDLHQATFIRFKQELLDDDFIDLVRVSKRGFDPAMTRLTIGLSDELHYKIDKEANQINISLQEKKKQVEKKEENKMTSNYKGELIIIDPGHGGNDSGAIGFSGLKEKTVNLQLVRKIEAKLIQKGFNVKTTRKRDQFISLSDRAGFANRLRANLFISLHTNYHSRQEVNGIETYAHYNAKQDDWALAWYVQDGILKHTNATDHGLKAANFAVLRQTEMPAILVEAGFLSNPREESKLRTKNYQNKIASGIVDGIVKFFENK